MVQAGYVVGVAVHPSMHAADLLLKTQNPSGSSQLVQLLVPIQVRSFLLKSSLLKSVRIEKLFIQACSALLFSSMTGCLTKQIPTPIPRKAMCVVVRGRRDRSDSHHKREKQIPGIRTKCEQSRKKVM